MSFKDCRIVGTGITPAQYLKQEVERGHPEYVLSRSDLVEIARCPARWRAGYMPAKETDATERGSLWDCLLLDKGGFEKRYAIIPDTYPAPAHHAKVKKGEISVGDPLPWNANATWCDEWLTDHQQFETVKTPDLEEAKAAVAAVMATEELPRLLDASATQLMVVGRWTDAETNLAVPLRALLDVVPAAKSPYGHTLIDYKTTVSAEMRAWTASVNKFNYHTQAALHLDLYVAAIGDGRTTFGHIVQESVPPFHVEKRILSEEFLNMGRAVYRDGLRTYCACLQSDVWPGYRAAIVLDGWQVAEPEPFMIPTR